MNYIVREMKETEYPLLSNFLYEAIFVPEGVIPPPKSIIQRPELQIYIEDFGKNYGDHAFVAEVDKKIVGAVWVRLMKDYGYIDEHTPSFAISLYSTYRGFGIGTAMMKTMLAHLKQQGFKRASLAVQKNNYAFHMYQKLDFKIMGENEEEYIMVHDL